MNFKRLFYIFIILSLFKMKANAQTTFSFDVGIASNKLDFRPINNSLKLFKNQGYMINVSLDYKFNKWLRIEVSPALLEKNYSVKNNSAIYQNINNAYLQFPISVKYAIRVVNKLVASGTSGIYYAYWLKSVVSGIAPNVFEQYSNHEGEELIGLEKIKYNYIFNSTLDNRSEFGWVAKIGLDYEVAKNLSCSLKGHYYQSITDQQKKIMILQGSRYNKTSVMTLGLAYYIY